jgi:hypothetical protein
MARVLMIIQFVFGLILASAGVGICIHAAATEAIAAEKFLPYMITGWVCLGVGLIISLATTRKARLREKVLLGARERDRDEPAEPASVRFSSKAQAD